MNPRQNVDLTLRNTFRLPARARYFITAHTLDDLLEGLQFAKDRNLRVYVLGGGSNVVLTRNLDGLVILVALKKISFRGDVVCAAAGENWHLLVQTTLERGLFGLENLALIPGCVGAAPIQNIGAYGLELRKRFTQLTAVHRRTLESRYFLPDDCEFNYRDSVFKGREAEHWIITDLTLQLSHVDKPALGHEGLRNLLDRQQVEPDARSVASAVMQMRRQKLPAPAQIGNVGSFFKNPVLSVSTAEHLKVTFPSMPLFDLDSGVKLSAAWLIDQAGLKGRAVGDIQVSVQHALVLINKGNGTGKDVARLIAEIRSLVESKYGIDLEVEPVFYP